MQTIYSYALSQIEQGADFSIDFATRSMKLNKKFIVKNGEFTKYILSLMNQSTTSFGCTIKDLEEYADFGFSKFVSDNMGTEDILIIIEHLFSIYHCSRPSGKSTNQHRYFMALPLEELHHNDLLYGKSRELSRFVLEFFVFKHIIDSSFTWQSDMGKWYWRSQAHPSLAILREWIEPNK